MLNSIRNWLWDRRMLREQRRWEGDCLRHTHSNFVRCRNGWTLYEYLRFSNQLHR